MMGWPTMWTMKWRQTDGENDDDDKGDGKKNVLNRPKDETDDDETDHRGIRMMWTTTKKSRKRKK